MATQEQLEIISPSGDVRFLRLDPAKGIINIGRHPENDLVLDSPRVNPFEAVLDFRQKPYRIISLGADGALVMSGESVAANAPRSLNLWDTFQLCGYSFILYEGEGFAINTGTGAVSVPTGTRPVLPSGAKAPALPAPTAGAAPGTGDAAKAAQAAAQPAAGAAAAAATTALPPAAGALGGLLGKLPLGRHNDEAPTGSGDAADASALIAQQFRTPTRLTTLPPDHESQKIVTDVAIREYALTVDQTALCPVNIANGGDIVASFDVTVEGLDPTWVVITPPSVNLNEGEHATVNIALTPPRLPNSLAGRQYFVVVVTSPNYAGESSRRSASLSIAPYYEFAVGELSPRQQTISYTHHDGVANLPVVNKGNSEVPYKVEAEDDQHACSFEFTVPNHDTRLARQAEFRLPANTGVNIPVRVTPNRRHIFGFRARSFSVTVTTTPLEGQQTPRSVLAQVYAAPLIGPWTVLLTLIALSLLALIIFRPSAKLAVDRTAVLAKQSVTLTWSASPFAELKIDNGVGPLSGTQGSIQAVPQDQTTTYHLTAENFLSRLLGNPTWYNKPSEVTVNVGAVLPTVQLSVLLPSGQRVPAGTGSVPPILRGEAITLYWDVEEADLAVLTSNGAPETIQPAEYIGKRTLTPDKDTVYTLEGKNKFGPDNKSLTIKVNEPPTQTPTPTPTIPPSTILRFDVAPVVITAGDSIKLDWEVANAKVVKIQGLDGGPGVFPPNGSLEQKPQKDTDYVLIPVNDLGDGAPQQRHVQVNPLPPTPTPTATPIPPKVESFVAIPQTVVKGSAQANAVQLTWLVSGSYKDISITGNNFPTQSGLPASGSITIAVSSSANFILSATLDKQIATQNVNVTVLDPTPTPTPVPTNTPIPTNTPLPPAPRIQFFTLASTTNPNPPDVTQTGASGNTVNYNVTAGSTVQFAWSAQNADRVKFQGADVPASGTTNMQISQQPTGPYVLTAINPIGQQVQSFINVTLQPKAAPPPPINVNGQNGPPIVVTWQYPYAYNIVGFRVYRAPVPYTNYVKVADENTLKPNVLQWTDTTTAATGTPCNWSYLVVAVYNDGVSADNKESARSTSPWYTRTCP